MGIVADMDEVFVANRPMPEGSAWLVGNDCWHALMADLTRIYRDKPWPPFDPKKPPKELFGAPLRHIPRMAGWGLAVALDPLAVERQEDDTKGVDAHVICE